MCVCVLSELRFVNNEHNPPNDVLILCCAHYFTHTHFQGILDVATTTDVVQDACFVIGSFCNIPYIL